MGRKRRGRSLGRAALLAPSSSCAPAQVACLKMCQPLSPSPLAAGALESIAGQRTAMRVNRRNSAQANHKNGAGWPPESSLGSPPGSAWMNQRRLAMSGLITSREGYG